MNPGEYDYEAELSLASPQEEAQILTMREDLSEDLKVTKLESL